MVRRLALLALGAVCLGLHATNALAAESAPAAEASAIDPAARAALARAATFLRAQPRFAFSADIAYEVLQDDGSVLEFGELRRYVVRRPDKLRIESERRAGGARVSYFDGSQLTVSSPDQNAYARVKLRQARSIDEALQIMRDRLGLPVPFAELLASETLRGLDETYDSAFVVGEERLEGVTCDHVAVRNEDNAIEVWIAKSEPPYVQRVRIAYTSLEGEPRFSARLSGWTLSPDTSDAVFRFDPPPNAERVRFAFGGSGTPPAEGEKKP